jgi:hypothetical protein
MGAEGIECVRMNWIYLADDRVQWPGSVNMVMFLRVA